MEYITEEEFNQSNKNELDTENTSEIKETLIEVVGNIMDPDDGIVTVDMIAEVMIDQFPEFMLAIAEENWVRGYHQALEDVDHGKKLVDEKYKSEHWNPAPEEDFVPHIRENNFKTTE
tara:strand:+ start:461 stop:814 length:354 start_codon:yes stop_codon:yes gene_type:complete